MSGITSPGIYYDFTAEAYFADPCPEPSFTQSLAKVLIGSSPLHARQEHPRLAVAVEDDDEATEKYVKAQAIGNAAHKIMLERGKVLAIIDAPDFKGKDARAERDAAAAKGLTPILAKHHHAAEQMVAQAKIQLANIPGCEFAFRNGSGEVVIACKYRGIWIRQMLDWPVDGLREIWDYKTTGMSASPYAAGKMMSDAGWNIQAAMSELILSEIDPDGAGRRKYLFACQENYEPFALTASQIEEDALTIGRKKLEYGIDRWLECMESGQWPAYPPRIIRPRLPEWDVKRWLEREVQEYDESQSPSVAPKHLTSLAGG